MFERASLCPHLLPVRGRGGLILLRVGGLWLLGTFVWFVKSRLLSVVDVLIGFFCGLVMCRLPHFGFLQRSRTHDYLEDSASANCGPGLNGTTVRFSLSCQTRFRWRPGVTSSRHFGLRNRRRSCGGGRVGGLLCFWLGEGPRALNVSGALKCGFRSRFTSSRSYFVSRGGGDAVCR